MMASKRPFSDRLFSERSGRVFSSPPETGEGMKVSSPVAGQGGREMLGPNSELVRSRVPQEHIFVRTVTATFGRTGRNAKMASMPLTCSL
jgi:hypothetical protein